MQPPPGGKRGSQSRNRGGDRGGPQHGAPGVKVISIERPLGGDVKLHTTDNAWKPDMKNEKKVDPETAKSEVSLQTKL